MPRAESVAWRVFLSPDMMNKQWISVIELFADRLVPAR